MAQWSAAFINDLPDSSFLYIEPGGSKDSEGKTTPRSLRHFPVKDASGNIDMPHLRNALARIPQSSLPDAVKARATSKAQALMPSDSTGRSEQFEGHMYRSWRPSPEYIERSEEDGGPILSGRFAVFNRWVEIDSAFEGHFMERIAPGAFAKTIREKAEGIKVVLSHGLDRSLGASVLGRLSRISEDDEGGTYEATLFRSVPSLLVDGLRAGVYGASFNGRPIKQKIEFRPKKSDHNPDGLPEVTRTEIALRDVGPTTFAAYDGTTSLVRSDNDEVALTRLLGQKELIRSLIEQGAATLDREDEPDPTPDEDVESTTPLEDEPPHSAEEVHEKEEEVPSWQL